MQDFEVIKLGAYTVKVAVIDLSELSAVMKAPFYKSRK
jgi:hypothetical protein